MRLFHLPNCIMHYTGSVSSDSDTDSTVTEGPYGGQDSTAMQRYYGMMSSRPVSEDHRILPPPVPSQPQPGVIAPRAPSISQPTGMVGPTRPPAPRLQDPQTPMPRDSLALQLTPSMQRQDSSYGGRAVVPRRPSLERDQRPILPPGLSTSPGAHSNISGQPPPQSTYTPVRPRRDSLSPPVPPTVQQSRRESISLGPQPSVQPVVWDPISAAVTQPSAPPGRRDSVILAQPPPSIHRNSLTVVTQAPPPVRIATDPLPIGIPHPITPMRRSSESGPRGQGTLVSTRVRFNDENLICPSPIPMHERRKGWHNRRGYVPSRPSPPFPRVKKTANVILLRDQLWTNKGDYKPAMPGREYPPDLASYPEYGEGWMNEEGMRIDMQHRLKPKVPLRSALKRPRQISNGGANPPPPFLPVARP